MGERKVARLGEGGEKERRRKKGENVSDSMCVRGTREAVKKVKA